MIKTKYILFSLVISNMILFGGSQNLISDSMAEKKNTNKCENILEYDNELVELLKEDSSPENYDAYNKAINDKITECINARVETDLTKQYEELTDTTFEEYKNLNKNRKIVDIYNEYISYQQDKTRRYRQQKKSIESNKKADFINKTQFTQLHEGLSTMLDLTNKYSRGIAQEKNTNKNRTSRIPNVQTTCL